MRTPLLSRRKKNAQIKKRKIEKESHSSRIQIYRICVLLYRIACIALQKERHIGRPFFLSSVLPPFPHSFHPSSSSASSEMLGMLMTSLDGDWWIPGIRPIPSSFPEFQSRRIRRSRSFRGAAIMRNSPEMSISGARGEVDRILRFSPSPDRSV